MANKSTLRNAKPIASAETPQEDEQGLERLVFFSDAVFAIAITLLALDLRLPGDATSLSNGELWRSLAAIWSRYLSFFISFIVIGTFWMRHHDKFRSIRRYDRGLLFINLLLLMAIAFIPFPTAVLSDSGNRTATIFYAATIIVVSLLLTWVGFYASRHRLTTEISAKEQRDQMLRSLIIPGVFLLSIGLAFINADIAKLSWLLIAPASSYLR